MMMIFYLKCIETLLTEQRQGLCNITISRHNLGEPILYRFQLLSLTVSSEELVSKTNKYIFNAEITSI